MKTLKVIKHTMTVEFTCPTNNVEQEMEIDNPNIQEGWYYSDWSYKYVEVSCKSCGETHKFEI